MKERFDDLKEEIKSRPVYFVICVLWLLVLISGIIGILSSCKSNKKENRVQSNTYVIISTPDGNIIAGYADDVTVFSNNYASITIGSNKYKTSPNNFIVIETKE